MRGTKSEAAFRAYLQGERSFTVVSEKQMAKCRAKFKKATDLDKKFARAWGWRSYVTVRSVLQGWMPDEKAALKDAEAWAKKAAKLDPHDYAPLWDCAFVYLNTDRFDKAIKTYEKAHKLYNEWTDRLDRKPGLLVEMAEAYVHAGQPKKGIALLKRATGCPEWYRWNTGWAHYVDKNYKSAVETLEEINLSPINNPQYVPEVRLFLAASHHRWSEQLKKEGKPKEAAAQARKAKAAVAAFRKDHPDYTKDDAAAARSRFKRPQDREHWYTALADLGL